MLCVFWELIKTHWIVWSWRNQSLDETRSWAHLSNCRLCKCLIWTVQFSILGKERRVSFRLSSPMISNFGAYVFKKSWEPCPGSTATDRVSHSGPFKGDVPDENPGPPVWRLTTSLHKNIYVEKTSKLPRMGLTKNGDTFWGRPGSTSSCSAVYRWMERKVHYQYIFL